MLAGDTYGSTLGTDYTDSAANSESVDRPARSPGLQNDFKTKT